MFQKSKAHLFLNNSDKNKMILIFFGTQDPKEILHQKIINVFTLTLRNLMLQ